MTENFELEKELSKKTKLNDLQLNYLINKKNKSDNGYGAFIGMIWNQHITTKEDFMYLLSDAINCFLELDDLILQDKIKQDSIKTQTPIRKVF